VKPHLAAVIALLAANLVANFLFTMPANMSIRASSLGAVTGCFPIGWIVLKVIFLCRLTLEKGAFETLQTTSGGPHQRSALAAVVDRIPAPSSRGALALYPHRGDRRHADQSRLFPLSASGLSLIANTAAVAYDMNPFLLGAMVG
jgi:lactate permease